MSEQEEPQNPPAKPRPEIPPKPSAQAEPAPPTGHPGGLQKVSGGKVRSIVSKFSKQDSVSKTEERTVNGSPKVTKIKRLKRPPTIKPKPKAGRASLPIRLGEPAPPLPMKRSRKPKEADQEGTAVEVEGGRSEPDGKEGEVAPTGGADGEERATDAPPPSSCDLNCSCLCHLQRPGMKLIWVPVDADTQVEEGGKEEQDEADDQQSGGDAEEWEDYVEEEETDGCEAEGEQTPVVDDAGMLSKERFQQSLDILISEGQRRRSDPGPHPVLSLAVTQSQSPPIPPKQPHPVQIPIQPSVSVEEEGIYEAILPVVQPRKNPPACKELDIPLIKVRKPARRSKLSYSTSDPTSEFQGHLEAGSTPEEAPPAIPPRIPLTPVHKVGIPLPQPTLEEWRTLRPSSPSGLSPQRVATPPLNIPHRAPPPPPNPQRLSSASLQSLPEKGRFQNNAPSLESRWLTLTFVSSAEENKAHEDEKEEERVDKRGSLQRQRSFAWESRLQDEPLYQTYRASVISKEIRRQTVCRNISKTSIDFPGDWAARQTATATGNGAPRSSSMASPGQSTLWQDLSNVRESGVLERLTAEECKYQESMFEVLTSEASYLRSLRVLIEHFWDSRDLEETMIIRDKKTLFSSILRVREVSERFLKDLEDRIFEDVVFSDICDIIHYHAQHNFPTYIDYVRNQIYQEKTYTTLIKNNAQFAAVISRLQESPQCQRLPFVSFLLLPFQRITRIKMLVENILKRTKEGTKEEQAASKALASVSKIIDECNTQVGKMRQMEELIHINQSLEFERLRAIPVISQTRYLEKKGELQEMAKGTTIFNMRMKFNPVYLFLFNDLLIIAAKKGAERFVVLDHAHRSLVQVQLLDEGAGSASPYEHCFNLTLLENHQGRTVEKLFRAQSQSDMHRWMAAFPNPTNPDKEDNEVIYEDWDCPQVQCVEQYIGQQTDELTLEPTEIVNVIRKTNEGMYEGIRLSDGQKGWFPVGNVIEITNEHVRRRNLLERYRVLQAASRVTKTNTIS